MADSDPEYDDQGSDDDDADMNVNRPRGSADGRTGMISSRPKGRGQAKWEAAASRNWELQEAADGSLEGVLGGIEEAGKRRRYVICDLSQSQLLTHIEKTAQRHDTVATRHRASYTTDPRSFIRHDGKGLAADQAAADNHIHDRFHTRVLRAESYFSARYSRDARWSRNSCE